RMPAAFRPGVSGADCDATTVPVKAGTFGMKSEFEACPPITGSTRLLIGCTYWKQPGMPIGARLTPLGIVGKPVTRNTNNVPGVMLVVTMLVVVPSTGRTLRPSTGGIEPSPVWNGMVATRFCDAGRRAPLPGVKPAMALLPLGMSVFASAP